MPVNTWSLYLRLSPSPILFDPSLLMSNLITSPDPALCPLTLILRTVVNRDAAVARVVSQGDQDGKEGGFAHVPVGEVAVS